MYGELKFSKGKIQDSSSEEEPAEEKDKDKKEEEQKHEQPEEIAFVESQGESAPMQIDSSSRASQL